MTYHIQAWFLDLVRYFLSYLIQLTFVVYFSAKMSTYSASEHIFIVRAYNSNNNNPVVTQFKLKATGPSLLTINLLIQKNERAGSVCDDILGNAGHKASF